MTFYPGGKNKGR